MAQENKEEKIDLFSEVTIDDLKLKNRVALAPMTRGRATEKFVPTDIMIKYYTQRGSDAGLVITEGTGISPQGLGWYKAPGIWSDEMVAKWKPVTESVHKAGGVIFLQLWHLGRQAHSSVTGQEIVSASPLPVKKDGQMTTVKGKKEPYETPHELTIDEIKEVVKDYGIAAENSIKAGMDGVEIHGANGYLVDQFLQSPTNIRKDKYGGDIKNRLLFMQEVTNEVISKVGNSRRVGIRLSPNGAYGGMGGEDNLELFDEAIKWLSAQKLGYIHIMDGLSFGYHNKTKEAYKLERGNKIIKSIDKKIMCIGNVGYTKETGNEAVSNGYTDMIAFGRPYLANPDLVYRFKNDIKLADVPEHINWWGWQQGPKGYIDYPTAIEEKEKQSQSDNAPDKNDNNKL